MPEFDGPRPEPVQVRRPAWSPGGVRYENLRLIAGAAGGLTVLAAAPMVALAAMYPSLDARGEVILYASLAAAIAGSALLAGLPLRASATMLGWTGLGAAVAVVAGLVPFFGGGAPGLLFAPFMFCFHPLAGLLGLVCAGYALSADYFSDLLGR